MWATMPPASRTVGERSLVFRTMSRLGCAFDAQLARRRRNFPFQTFRLLHDKSLAAEFRQLPDCRLDAWTRQMRESYPRMDEPDFLHEHATVALQAHVDTSRVEARHAAIRRALAAKSM